MAGGQPGRRTGDRLAESSEEAAVGCGLLPGSVDGLFLLDVPPLRAPRRLAATAARALRVAERQPHLEREVGAQEVGKVGAVGLDDELLLVLAEAQMVEQDVARFIAQHLVQRRPRRRRHRAARRTASRSRPNRGSRWRGSSSSRSGQTLPCVARAPGGCLPCTAISRVMVAHSAGAPSSASVACHAPSAGAATSAYQK